MSIDNYEQYKRVINQITGRLYMHIYILETKKKKKWGRGGACVHACACVCVFSVAGKEAG